MGVYCTTPLQKKNTVAKKENKNCHCFLSFAVLRAASTTAKEHINDRAYI